MLSSVSIKYAGNEIEGSPFQLQAHAVGDASKCKFVENVAEKIVFGKKNRMTVDATKAGEGAVTCNIKSEAGRWELFNL